MSSKSYAYAVANVRAAENELLTPAFFEQLVNSVSASEAEHMLSDKGIELSDTNYMQNVWNYVSEIAPEPEKLEFLIVKNDFHNLKSILKGTVANADGRRFCLKPSIIDSDELYEAVKNKKFDNLPSWISEIAASGYELVTSVMDGRMLDMFLDSKSLETTIDFSKRTDSKLCVDFAEAFAAMTNIKIALRLSENEVGESTLDYAFAECADIDSDALKSAVLKGKNEVAAYVESTAYAFLAESIAKSYADFERECDNFLSSLVQSARMVSFGIEPVVCYYLAKESEYKNLLLITGAKNAALSEEAIRKRMREVYV